MSRCMERAFIDQHFAGSIAPADERQMRAHLPQCVDCTKFYERHLLLARLDPEASSAEDRIARGLGLARESASNRWAASGGAVVAAFAMAAALFLFVRFSGHETASPNDGFTARGGNIQSDSAPQSRLFVYDVRQGNKLLGAGDTFDRNDEFAFAYENGVAKSRLMVFGVDDHRHVYWFYPAWTRADEDPTAIAIEKDSLRHELPDAVKHHIDGNALQVRAVFMDSATTVKQVEAMLAAQPSGPLPIVGAVESSVSLVVSP